MAGQLPYTEQRHPASAAIDTASPQEIASLMLREDDIFTGWDGSMGVFNESTIQTVLKIQDIVADLLQDYGNNAIVLAGCGTSGRLAFMTARTMNIRLETMGKQPCVEYLIAGNDLALFTSQEGFEDDPILGQEVLEKVTQGRRRVLYVGITCGLSAPFVAGQLDLCMKQSHKFIPVLLGFNPVSAARNVAIEKWDKTFYEVAEKMTEEESEGRAHILNPIIGPELITGSSRMKAGTSTKLLLDTVFTARPQMAASGNPEAFIRALLTLYRTSLFTVHSTGNDLKIAEMMEMAAFSLRNGGHVYYLGDEDLGLVGMIDASECVPTYGTSIDDVRGFLSGGYKSLRNKDGDMSDRFQISLEYFQKSVLPATTEADLLVVVARDGDISFVPDLRSSACRAVVVNVHMSTSKMLNEGELTNYDRFLQINLECCMSAMDHSIREQMARSLVEVTAKWFCNALSTGAHVLIGKVCQNLMVDVNVSNNKLFHRAVGIVKDLTACDTGRSRHLLLRAIYQKDDISEDISQLPITNHLEVASLRTKIVPMALVLGLRSCTVAEAAGYLRQHPVVRHAIMQQKK